MGSATVLLVALALDALVGDPDWLWRRAPHPVVVLGGWIGAADARLNHGAPGARRRKGLLALVGLLAAVLALGGVLWVLLAALGPAGHALEAVLVAVLLAQRSLHEHVARVAGALSRSLGEGRRAVSMIVGRDPDTLDRPGAARAAIESLAENLSDGVVAPAFWYLVGGLPGLLAYKLVNTADSMIGHISERHRDFGRAAARLDDALNWVPARLSVGLIALARPSRLGAIVTAARLDAPRHRSPNAGWPEAAWAAATGLALGGPRSYGEGSLSEPVLNAAGRRTADADDIRASLGLFVRVCLVQAGVVALIALL